MTQAQHTLEGLKAAERRLQAFASLVAQLEQRVAKLEQLPADAQATQAEEQSRRLGTDYLQTPVQRTPFGVIPDLS